MTNLARSIGGNWLLNLLQLAAVLVLSPYVLDQLGADLKAEFSSILASTGTKEAVAAKQLAASLKVALQGVVSHPDKRASDILVALGIRQRAAKTEADSKKEKDAALAPVIEALVALAQDKAGDNAVSALRRAYLTLQAKANVA